MPDLFPNDEAIRKKQRVAFGVVLPLALLFGLCIVWWLTPWSTTFSDRYTPGALLLFGAMFCGPFMAMTFAGVVKIGWPRRRYAFLAGLVAIVLGMFGGAAVLLIMSLLMGIYWDTTSASGDASHSSGRLAGTFRPTN